MSSIFPIVLNANNRVDSNTYTYKFPRGTINFSDAQIALSQINLYYSWPNIDAALYGNNRVVFNFPESSGMITTNQEYPMVIPDGNYTVEDLNKFFQSYFISINKYLVNAAGQNVYYFEILSNPNTYSIQLISYPVPVITPDGWTNPGMNLPTISSAPEIEINTNFGRLIGFTPGPYTSAISNIVPEMSPVSSVLITCSLLNNKFTNPNNVMYAFVSGSAQYGQMLSIQPQELIFNNIDSGFYNEITIKFVDSKFNKINIKDPNLIIYLIVKLQ